MQSKAVVMTTEEFIAKLESLNHKYNSPLVVKACLLYTSDAADEL